MRTHLRVKSHGPPVVRFRVGSPAYLPKRRGRLDHDLVVIGSQRRSRLVLFHRIVQPAHGRQEISVPGSHHRVVWGCPVRFAVPFFRLGHSWTLSRRENNNNNYYIIILYIYTQYTRLRRVYCLKLFSEQQDLFV